MQTGFQNLNPAVSFVYLLLAVILSMVLLDPLLLMLGLVFVFGWCLIEKCALDGSLLWITGTGLFVLLLNPLLNHRGRTVLFYFFENPVTLESFLYGFTAAVSIMTVFLIFMVYNRIITPDKFMFLFSKRLPRTSLLIMMCLRFIPALQLQYRELSGVQRVKHPVGRKRRRRETLQEAFRLLTLLFSGAVCGAIETAQSMCARGYGVYARRTAWREQRLTAADLLASVYILCAFLGTIGLWYGFDLKQDFFQTGWQPLGQPAIYIAAGFFYAFPILTEGVERLKWSFSNWNS